MPVPEFPSAPVAPSELLERFLPAALDAVETPEGLASLALALGVRLEGEGGGEWLVDVRDGRVEVRAGARDGAVFSYVQSVEDWRGALWEGRGGLAGRLVTGLFRPDPRGAQALTSLAGPALPDLLRSLAELRGLLRVVVTGDEGAPDWRVALLLGPGAVPAEPTTEVCVAAADLDRIEAGALEPMEAFLAGRIRVTGDLTLMLQLQAAQLQAAAAAGRGAGGA